MSPVAEALRRILKPKQVGLEILVLDYSDVDTFRKLWFDGLASKTPAIGGYSVNWYNDRAAIILVGELPPLEAWPPLSPCLEWINFRSHLTAASWVGAWRLKIPDASARVILLCPNRSVFGSPVAKALSALFEARAADNSSLVPGVEALRSPSLVELRNCIGSSRARRRLSESGQAMIRATLWEGLVSTRERHHAVSNVLGALLLSSKSSGKPLAQDFLLALVRACSGGASHEISNPWIAGNLRKNIGAAVLIDDMAEIWEPFLRIALGFEPEKSIAPPLETIIDLPGRLNEFLASGRRFLSVGDLIPGADNLKQNFALFLDLRLFPTGPAADNLLANYFKAIAKLGADLLKSERNLPWLDSGTRESLGEELSLISRWKAGALQPRPPYETLLPRLISLLDPTLPIIIFSSTHRIDLVEPFRNFGNICTVFQKPILSAMAGGWGDAVEELRADFISSLEQAAGMLRLRRAIQSFEKPSRRGSTGIQSRLLPSEDGYLIEIFFDESERGEEEICSGGVVVMRQLKKVGEGMRLEPVVSDSDVFKCLESARPGGLWGWSPEATAIPKPVNGQKGYLPKGKDLDFNAGGDGLAVLDRIIAGVKGALGNASFVFPFAVIGARKKFLPDWLVGPTDPANRADAAIVFDASLRMMVQHALEGLLYRSDLREILDKTPSRVAVDIGTRDFPCKSRDWSFFDKFGIELSAARDTGGLRWRASFHSEDGFQIVGETIAANRFSQPFQGRIVRARAVPLYDFGKCEEKAKKICRDNCGVVCVKNCAAKAEVECEKKKPGGVLPAQLHYFADTISHVALHDMDAVGRASSAVKEFFESGWIADFRSDKEESKRFVVGRTLDRGNRVGAIRLATKLKLDFPANGAGINIFEELSHATGSLNRSELIELFSDLGDSNVPTSATPPEEKKSLPRQHLVGGSRAPTGGGPRMPTPAQFEALKVRWRIRFFEGIDEYGAARVLWHQIPGYRVLRAGSGKIKVFADLTLVDAAELPSEFIVPYNANLFRPDGEPSGFPFVLPGGGGASEVGMPPAGPEGG